MRRNKKGASVHICICGTCRLHPYSAVAKQHRAINRVLATLDERNRRRFVGLLALQWGRGAVERLMEITGLSRNTICRGRDEIQHVDPLPVGRIRYPGGGRKPVEKRRSHSDQPG